MEIKSHFSGWHEVDKACARKYAQFLLANLQAIPEGKRVEYIEKEKLRGISVKELLGE